MESRLRRSIVVAVVAVAIVGLGGAQDHRAIPKAASAFPTLSGPYLGQQPPGTEPELFAPGIVSTGLATRDLAMTPDGKEIYFGVSVGSRSMILVTRQVEGRWIEPVVAPFSGTYLELEPAISPAGKRFFFLSTRPQEGQEEKAGWVYQDIWVMDRVGNGWGEPYNLGPPVNSEAPEYYPSVTRDGTLYFTREGENRQSSIYRSRLLDGAYQEPEKLPEQVNCGTSQFNAFVAPDESYVIVPVLGREDSLGGVSYYIVFRDSQDRWSEPINMGEKLNTPDGRGWSASVSPDGKYLFFMSSRLGEEARGPLAGKSLRELVELATRPQQGSSSIYWIGAGIIEGLRPEGFGPGG